jgi:hypothetical protein
MRVNILKIFALILFLTLTGAAFGQPYQLISMTNYTWRYNQSGGNLGALWRAANYDDSIASWQSGKGVFALETDNPFVIQQTNTVLSLSNAANARITTYYFRTHFTLTNDPYRVNVIVTNLIDDGAVFYVNGAEANRLNMPATGTITYITTASSQIEATNLTFTVPYDLLVQGDNVFEVEVHNVNSTSSDIVFGLAAAVVNPTTPSALVFTNQPRDFTSTEAAPVTFSAGVSGFPITYVQWFYNGSAIPGANRLSYTITNVNLTNAGTYSLSVSNASTGLISTTPATLSIIADTNGPVILAADGTDTTTNVVVTFNERVLITTATNLANYVITNIGSGFTFVPTKATLAANGSNVTLVTSTARVPNTNYLVIVNNVRDATPRTNLIAPNSAFPISTSISLADEFSFFYLYNPVVAFGDNPVPTNIWKRVGFNPYTDDPANSSAWADNNFQRGIAYYGGDDVPGPIGFHLSQSDLATPAYFVLPIDFKASPLGSSLMVSYLIDDGAVFYLNETEFLRVGLPNGPITYQTTANRAGYPSSYQGPFSASLPFKVGLNSLAVELHTVSALDTNYGFAVRVSADISSFAVGPVVITSQPTNITAVEGQSATFTFNGAGPSRFQWLQNGSPIAGATNASYTIPAVTFGMNSNRYAVTASNPSFSTTSSNAFLFVSTDTNSPSLVSAYCISSNQILVSFSESVSLATAQNAANYLITNRTAPNLNILSATVANGSNVLLTVSTGGAGQYVLVASTNIQDNSTGHNPLSRTNAATVGLKVSLPIDTDWKYNNLGQDLGVAWHAISYPQESTWSNGLAVIWHDDVVPPNANTLLPLTSPTTSSFVTTFYFRKALPLATGATNTIVTFSHVIDDGIVAYLNNSEFYRLNMPTGNPTFNTLANLTVDNAALVGPFNVLLSSLLTGGPNELAAEVHQASGTSGDFAFGMELNINAPSLPIVNTNSVVLPAVSPKLVLNNKATNAIYSISWTNQPGHVSTLLSTTNLLNANTKWVTNSSGIILNGNVSTYTTTKTNNTTFYRLRVD